MHTDLSIFGNFFVKYKSEITSMIIQPCVLEENQTYIKNVLNEMKRDIVNFHLLLHGVQDYKKYRYTNADMKFY